MAQASHSKTSSKVLERMWLTTSFVEIDKGNIRQLFFLITSGYIEDNPTIAATLEPLLEKLARDLGGSGAVVRPFTRDVDSAADDVLSKNWRGREFRRIRQTPGLLILDVNFSDFDPQTDPWIHLSLRDVMTPQGQVNIFELEEADARGDRRPRRRSEGEAARPRRG
jgi:hypothetical protein